MLDSSILVYVIAEIAVLAIALCAFLLLHVKKLKAIIAALNKKVASVRKSVRKFKKETKKIRKELDEKNKIVPKTFLDYLDEEIDGTKEFHQSLNPDRDIVLDIAPDASMDRQATSLRHALLIAEKEARYAGDDDSSSWDVLQTKFQQIIQFYMSASESPEVESEEDSDNSEEIESYKKRIENLERFKKLFFEVEDKWAQSKKLADDYYLQLLAMGQDIGAGEDFDALLNKYAGAFDELGNLIVSEGDGDGDGDGIQIDDEDGDQPFSGNTGKMVFANQEEMQRLRDMAVDQYKVIEELKKKLVLADTGGESEQAIAEMTAQLEIHQRFLKESETCSQLIEDELSRALQENQQLRDGQGDSGSVQELNRVEEVLSNLNQESRDMLQTIAQLEQSNAELLDQLDASEKTEGGVDPELPAKYEQLQQELLNLQTQHIELEERYLELKMQ